jgi:hypothetical protein
MNLYIKWYKTIAQSINFFSNCGSIKASYGIVFAWIKHTSTSWSASFSIGKLFFAFNPYSWLNVITLRSLLYNRKFNFVVLNFSLICGQILILKPSNYLKKNLITRRKPHFSSEYIDSIYHTARIPISYSYKLEGLRYFCIQLFQLRLSTSKAEKSNTSAKGCWESLWKFINLLTIPSSLSRSYSTFPLYSWTTLIEIAV